MKTMKSFVEKSHLNAKLISAVVRQSGGWEYFREKAPDIANHGASGGYGGWIYYTETCKFFKRNRSLIMALAEEMAQEFGEDTLAMIKGFNCFKGYDLTSSEIAKAIYQGKGEMVDQIENCLSWFALEEVCRSYTDLCEADR